MMSIQFTQSQFTVNGLLDGEEVLWIEDKKNPKFKKLKTSGLLFWSKSHNKYYLPNTPDAQNFIKTPQNDFGKIALQKIKPINMPHLIKMTEELKLKGYSTNTIRTYTNEFAQLLYILKDYPLENLTDDKIRSYFLYCHNELKISENSIHSRINAVKFYFKEVLKRESIFINIPRPKKPLLLPKTLNVKELKKMFDCTQNSKHLLILKLAYGMGLRVSEIVKLKIEDIDSGAMKVHIQCAKGKKDRYVNLPESVLQEMRQYYKEYKPQKFLFEGKNNEEYSIRSTQNVFKNAMKKAGIRKTIGIHSMRHSYATHLLEMGTDVSLIQKLLGHNQIKTTLIYTQITEKSINNVKSPLDRM